MLPFFADRSQISAVVIAVVLAIIGALTLALTASAAEVTSTAYVTGYSIYDNDPPGTAISNPVLHKGAGGIGTYADPITLAVGIVNGGPMVPAGTRFYIPNLRRYFIVEDTCASCATNVPAGAASWIDVYVDGSTTSTSAANSCMNAITGNWKVIKNPASNYVVVSGAISKASGCTAQYGNTLVFATAPPTTTPPVVTTTTPPVTTTTVTPLRATSLSCPVPASPTVGQVVSCTYK